MDGVKFLSANITAIKGANYLFWFKSALAATDIEVTTVADSLFVWPKALVDIDELRHKLTLVGFLVAPTDKTRLLEDKTHNT